jgi:transcriptional regulator with XRE-family HTH domain
MVARYSAPLQARDWIKPPLPDPFSNGCVPAGVVDNVVTERESFAALLHQFRERRGISRNALATEIHYDPSYLSRIESGEREAPAAHIIDQLARALRLTAAERGRFFVAAGYVPDNVMQLGVWDDALEDVTNVLTDPRLSEAQRQEFRRVVRSIAFAWRFQGAGEVRTR